MTSPDDTSRERDDRPTENGHAIPFGEGVYGLGRSRPDPPDSGARAEADAEPDQPYGEPPPVEPPPAPRPEPAHPEPRPEDRPAEPAPQHRTSRSTPNSADSGTFADEPAAAGGEQRELPPDFDFGRLAAELGFEGHAEGRQCVGFCPICRSADLVRTVATPELRAAWTEFSRELARALSAAADRYAGPGDADPATERITEIPID